ncbi:MAG TPA: c-type cytochrome, partial [Burkholderiaceae bacterium]
MLVATAIFGAAHVAWSQATPPPTAGAPAGAAAATPQNGGRQSGEGGGGATRGTRAANGQSISSYPQRELAPKEVVDRGKGTFGVSCAFCHGSDAGGGEVGPNLHRSEVVLNDKDGELIAPIVHGARQAQGMPAIPLTDDQIKDVAAYLHSFAVTSRTDPGAENINIVIGNQSAGEAYFQKTCASCHTVASMKDVVSKISDPKTLQQWWLVPGGGGRRGAVPTGLKAPELTATVTTKSGEKIEGVLDRMDDFNAIVKLPNGTMQDFNLTDGSVKVDV